MKVGDYVRTKKEGIIGKIIEQNEQYVIAPYKNNELFVSKDNIKSSPNIIDLIEVGDYVNGHKVFDDMRVDTDDYGNDFIEIGIEIDNMLNHYIREEDIKSIVTKEQFESMEYKVGD